MLFLPLINGSASRFLAERYEFYLRGEIVLTQAQ